MLNLSTTRESVDMRTRLVIEGEACFIEWSDAEPLSNVMTLIEGAGRQGVVFDLEDADLWEFPTGGYRLHGMFLVDLI